MTNVDNEIIRAAKEMTALALAISRTATDCAAATKQFAKILIARWIDIENRYPEFDIDACWDCPNRRRLDLTSKSKHPCPVYKKTIRCTLQHSALFKFFRKVFLDKKG
ncbi:MAG: hypothetical protein E7047_03915 [Lentisphaerae bacterium]|nr:hypothetical protein [Lentisphaerota bacterium]